MNQKDGMVAKVQVKIECAELDETISKIERLNELAKEASSIFDELAGKEIFIRVSSVRE